MARTGKGGFEARGIAALHDLPGVTGDLALQQVHLLGAEGPATQVLTGETAQDLGIRNGEPDAVALDGGVLRLLVGGLVLVDADQRTQSPAGITGKSLAQAFNEVFFAHEGGMGSGCLSPCGLHPGLVTVGACVAPFLAPFVSQGRFL
jgi:hypothetical protein